MFSLMKLRLKHIFLYVPLCLPARLRKISEIKKDQKWHFRKWENSHSYIWRSNIWLCTRDMSRWAVFAWTKVWKLLILKFWTPNHPTIPCPTEATAIHLPFPSSEIMIIRAKKCKHIIKIATENTTYHRFVCLHQIEMHFSNIIKWILMASKAQANSTQTALQQ